MHEEVGGIPHMITTGQIAKGVCNVGGKLKSVKRIGMFRFRKILPSGTPYL
jgi:hypothetical protein